MRKYIDIVESADNPKDYHDLLADLEACETANELRTWALGSIARRAVLPADLRREIENKARAKKEAILGPQAKAEAEPAPSEETSSFRELAQTLAMCQTKEQLRRWAFDSIARRAALPRSEQQKLRELEIERREAIQGN